MMNDPQMMKQHMLARMMSGHMGGAPQTMSPAQMPFGQRLASVAGSGQYQPPGMGAPMMEAAQRPPPGLTPNPGMQPSLQQQAAMGQILRGPMQRPM